MTFIARYPRASVLAVLAFIVTGSALAQSPKPKQADPQELLLSKIEFKGLKHITEQQALELSGLIIGAPVTPDLVDAAAQKLSDSGLFGKMSFRLRSVKQSASVEFEVEELQGSIPVVFDNFVWFSEDELFAGVKSELPTF